MQINSELENNNFIFTLLCACKNEEKDINLLIDSIKVINYDFDRFEVIFADDSTDNTVEIISNSLINTPVNWRIISCDNEGCCRARNKALQQSKGKYIIFLTADTILKSDYLRLLDHNKKNFKIIMPESSCLLPNESPSIYEKYSQTCHRIIILKTKLKSQVPYTSQGYCVKKEQAFIAGLISPPPKGAKNYCNDFTLVKKMLKNNNEYLFDKRLLVYHKQPDNLKQFFKEKVLRGKMSRRQKIYQVKLSRNLISCIALLKLIRTIFKFPLDLFTVFKFSIEFKDINFNSFLILFLVDNFAFFIGEFFE